MNDQTNPASRELNMAELYGETPVPISLREIYTLPGIPYAKDTLETLRPLLESVRQEGIQKPVRLIPRMEGGYYLVDGYRRCHAAALCHLSTVPSCVEQKTVQEVYQEILTMPAVHSLQPDEGRQRRMDRQTEHNRPKHILQTFQELLGRGRQKHRHKPVDRNR